MKSIILLLRILNLFYYSYYISDKGKLAISTNNLSIYDNDLASYMFQNCKLKGRLRYDYDGSNTLSVNNIGIYKTLDNVFADFDSEDMKNIENFFNQHSTVNISSI